MKVLAIIPAAEGLDTLPNRNMRVINGKPLIYYALTNAKESKYVNDIVVTSNSDEVLMLVSQIGGATCYRRPETISGIDVTLEKVINDVRNTIDFEKYDYVVTMQSISATLKASTLDDALEQCADEDIDTMISVIEKRNYFWKDKKDEPIAEQDKRVSKKDMNPTYMETGAFFISRPSYISDTSRIGGKKKLYVLDSDEGVDVITFGDLKQAEYVLGKKKIAFYVNGNSEIGMGHIKRVLMLSDEFFVKPTIFYNNKITKREVFGEAPYEIIGVDDTDNLINMLREGKYSLLINDVLQTSKEYMKKIRELLPRIKTVNFEDDGDGAYFSDLVINALYDECTDENWKVGADYYIAPKMYLLQSPVEIKAKVQNVFVTFGGADPSDYTNQVLEIICKKEFSNYNFNVVIGPANNKAIKKTIPENVAIHRNLSSLIKLMRESDVAISSRGRTGFELAICGIPTICVAQNERERKHTYFSEKNGFKYLGYRPSNEEFEQELRRLLNSTLEERKNIQKEMQKHDLKNGRKKIIELINSI